LSYYSSVRLTSRERDEFNKQVLRKLRHHRAPVEIEEGERRVQPAATDASTERLRIHRLGRNEAPHAGEFAADVRRGLSSERKHLPPKYFYDELGSQLFDAICLLPEYYLTRAEDEILARHAFEIVEAVGAERITLLELGSGSAVKTRLIIEALLKRQGDLLYIPVDISASALETSARVLLQSFPTLRIAAYASDYEGALSRLRESVGDGDRLLSLFLGSNIGNFERDEAQRFLRDLRNRVLRADDALLLGADLKKDARALEAAYDDALGVTAAFNLNVLARINREFDADFDLRAFKHVALYEEARGRIEIYIESRREQLVQIRKLKMSVAFMPGERIHTENSHKYALDELSHLATLAGFKCTRTWLDEAAQFSSNLFIARDDERA
jgi:L-histidine Nalpha-methyltransferase